MNKVYSCILQIVILFIGALIVFYLFDKFYKDINILACSLGATTGYGIFMFAQERKKSKNK